MTAVRARAPRLGLLLAGAHTAWPVAAELRRRYRVQATYTVKIPGDDEIYEDLHEWVLSRMSAREQHALVAWTGRRGFDEFADEFRWIAGQRNLRCDSATTARGSRRSLSPVTRSRFTYATMQAKAATASGRGARRLSSRRSPWRAGRRF